MEAQQVILDCNGAVARWKGSNSVGSSGWNMIAAAAEELGDKVDSAQT
jgi:hypothetical protein